MTRDEIKRIGLEAGMSSHAFGLANEEAWQQVERFVALVAAAEREACAALVETLFGENLQIVGCGIAAEIRARGQE